MEPIFLNVADASASIGLSRSSVYEMLNRGELESVRVGTSRLIPVDALRRWAAQQREKAGTDALYATA